MGDDLSGKAVAFEVGERGCSHASPVSTQCKQAVKATPPFTPIFQNSDQSAICHILLDLIFKRVGKRQSIQGSGFQH